MTNTRQPILAGTWYPAQPDRLRREVRSYLSRGEPARLPAGDPIIALAPHAGYRFSGPVAGALFGALAHRRFEAVFILAPNHRAPLRRPALGGQAAFATPLGEVPVAADIVQRLAAEGFYGIDDHAHAGEHAVEIQLPLLQCAWPEVPPIVPILLPRLTADQRRQAARALDPWRDGRHLLLVSSDLTHYGEAYRYVPFDTDVPERLERLDRGAIDRFLDRDADGLAAYREDTGITMCGLDAAAVAVDWTAPRPCRSALLAYERSAELTGDPELSVSYAAAVICLGREHGRQDAADDGQAAAGRDALTAAERDFLVRLARAAVDAAVRGAGAVDPAALAAEAGLPLSRRLLAARGAFVTLTVAGRLRGCIGSLESDTPLAETVAEAAVGAALRDPRFDPVAPHECPRLAIEVSALTPPRPVAGPHEIEIGRHGILLARGGRRAVFLPQVPGEQGWDLPTTLDHLALKAGLPADAWRRDCSLRVFEAEICRERPPAGGAKTCC